MTLVQAMGHRDLLWWYTYPVQEGHLSRVAAHGDAEPPLDPMLAWEIGEPRGHLLHHRVLRVHEMQIGGLCLGLVLTFGVGLEGATWFLRGADSGKVTFRNAGM